MNLKSKYDFFFSPEAAILMWRWSVCKAQGAHEGALILQSCRLRGKKHVVPFHSFRHDRFLKARNNRWMQIKRLGWILQSTSSKTLLYFFKNFLKPFHLSITIPTKPRHSTIAQCPSARFCGATNASLILVFILMIDVFTLSSILFFFAPSSRIVSHKFNGN